MSIHPEPWPEPADDVARDGHTLLRAVYHRSSPRVLRHLPAVEVLRRILAQHTLITADRSGNEVIKLRDADTDGSRRADAGSSRRTTPMPAGAANTT